MTGASILAPGGSPSGAILFLPSSVMPLILQPQELPWDHPQSTYRFDPSSKPLVATPAAIREFGPEQIEHCINLLRRWAKKMNGLDHLQVFVDDITGAKLWFIEDDDGGGITALLPDDY